MRTVTFRLAELVGIAILSAIFLGACSSSNSGSTTSGNSSGTAFPTTNQKVGVFKIHFNITGYYNLSGSTEATGNGLLCTDMARNGTATGGGFNTWQTPWGSSVTVDGHKITDISQTVDNFRSNSKGNLSPVHFSNLSGNGSIEIDGNDFDPAGEGATNAVTVNPDASGSFEFQNAPDQSLSNPNGSIATVSGTVTWSCVDLPQSQAPTTT
jgi:hypothetical protein